MTEDEQKSPSLSGIIQGISSALEKGHGLLSTGDAADLRRMDPKNLDAAAFWKVEALFLDPILSGDGDVRYRQETQWASVIVGLATIGSLHQRGSRLGGALHRAGFSELRFIRLLRADDEILVDEVPSLARFLRAKSIPVDWTDVARLMDLFARNDSDRAERHRRSIARDYYQHDAQPSEG